MRHMVSGRQLGRNSSHRRAMLRNTAANLIRDERIRTTEAKAKELRKVIDKLITWAKRGDLHSRRLARPYVDDRKLLAKLFGEIRERFEKRKGGYTRIIKLGPRLGDAAPMVLIELIPDEKSKPKDKSKPKKKAKKDSKPEPSKDAKKAESGEEEKEPKPQEDDQVKARLKDNE